MTNIISGVYVITNSLNGHRYIGSSVNIYVRWKSHRSELRRGVHRNSHLQRAWNKYGEENFTFSMIEYCEDKSLMAREQFYLDSWKPEYNASKNADAPLRGKIFTPLHRQRLSEAWKGRVISESAKQRMSESRIGHKHSKETRQKISAAHKGKVFGAERVKRMSDAALRFFANGGKNGRSKIVRQYSLEGELIAEYENAKIAADKFGLDHSALARCARGENKTAGGYIWRYISEEE